MGANIVASDGGCGGSSSARTAPLRSLPQHSYAKLKQRDDRSLMLTFLDWALIPLVGLDVRCWHNAGMRDAAVNVRYLGQEET
jgi:hypothetical protein